VPVRGQRGLADIKGADTKGADTVLTTEQHSSRALFSAPERDNDRAHQR
jgi:hypothetical protein